MTSTATHNRTQTDAPLETGWLPSTPDGDNIVTDMSRAQAQAYRALAVAGGHTTRADEDLGMSMTDTNVASPFGNVAILSRPLASDKTRLATSAMRDFYGSAAGGPFIVFSAWPTLELDADGFTLVGHPPLMVLWKPGRNRSHFDADVRTVTSAEELADFERALIEGYPVPELLPWPRVVSWDRRHWAVVGSSSWPTSTVHPLRLQHRSRPQP